MSLITGNGTTYPASFEAPDDMEERDAASHLVSLEALADRTENLRGRIEGDIPTGGNLNVPGDVSVGGDLVVTDDATIGGLMTSANVNTGTVEASVQVNAENGVFTNGSMSASVGYFIAERTVTIAVDGPVEAEAIWEKVLIGANDVRWTTNANTEAFLRICLNQYVPNKASVTGVVARYEGGPGHTDLPENMPRIVLFRKRIGTSGAASGIVGSAVDPSLDHNAFQAEHDIPLELDPSVTLDTDTGSYYVLVWSESGANALLEAIFSGLLVTYTYTRVEKI